MAKGDLVTFKLKEADVERLRKIFRKVIQRGGNFLPVWTRVVPTLRASILTNFRVGGRPQKWAALKPSTIKQRMTETPKTWPGKYGQPILIRHGTLLQSIGTYMVMTLNKLIYGTPQKKAKRLHFGDSSKHLVARPFMMLQNEDVRNIALITAYWVFQGNLKKVSRFMR